jgi:predicted DNA-binding helix-hairpin-helix protein
VRSIPVPSKWRSLVMGAEYDRAEVPLYEASGRRKATLLKTLLSSACRMDCRYCPFRAGCPLAKRMSWETDKLVRITMDLYRRGVIKGLFLSSGFYGDPDAVAEKQLEVVEELRRRGFKGYIHLRLMPGVHWWYIRRAAELADRIGVNLETTDPSRFSEIAPSKGDWRQDILYKLEYMARESRWRKAGVDTQLMAGVAGETDEELLRLTWRLYRILGISRVHYSAFRPVKGTPMENNPPAPLWREHRLYQASELIRRYGYTMAEITQILDERGMLPNKDPKEAYAEANPDLYPVDINNASLHELLRVPGIGPSAAELILRIREHRRITAPLLIRILGVGAARKVLRYVSTGDRTLV